tara:strand:+ start:947 stop:1153 length:207 start_codon:yes stop_codon:yes gene_type:complete
MIDWKNCKDATGDNQYCDKGVEGCNYCDDMDYVLTYEKQFRKCEDFIYQDPNIEKHVKEIYRKRGVAA